MPLQVSGKNISIGAALRDRISGRIAEATSKYFRGGYSGHAIVGRDGFGFRTECVLHLDSGALLEAEGMAADAYESADRAATNIESACPATSGAAKIATRVNAPALSATQLAEKKRQRRRRRH